MSDRPENFLRCARVRIKMCRKDYDWSVGLVYNPRELPGVTTARPGVAGVLQVFAPPPPISALPDRFRLLSRPEQMGNKESTIY
jgi:hypothetical protein